MPVPIIYPIICRVVLSMMTATLQLGAIAMLVLAVRGMVSTVSFKGGLMARIYGIEVVSVTGDPAILVRRLLRGALVWGTVFVLFYPFGTLGQPWFLFRYEYISLAIILGLAAWSVWHPSRGLQDRIAGTHLVPQ